MDNFQTIVLLMSAAILLVGFAQKLRLPYPIALLIGGTLLAFVPGLNEFSFDPNLILGIVLPPILYYGAYEISFHEFSENAQEIFSLAIGLVVVTTIVIALLFKWMFPDLPWALAFAFGAINSPPDAITATSILRRFSISNRLITILEGESLINDAFALVFYRLSLIALVTGIYTWHAGILEFFKVVFGGLLVGFFMGLTVQRFSSYLLSSVIGTMFSFTLPYLTFFIADRLGVSGVLAVVLNGLMLSRIVVKHHDSHRHFLATTSWDIFTILLHCFVFILIGLQLGNIINILTFAQIALYIMYSIIISFVMLLIRMIWVNGHHIFSFLHALHHKKSTEQCTLILREGFIIGWSSMRGIVSLAAVLSLPFTMMNGEPLIGRDIVIFITFFVIFQTILLPGLTLPKILKWLNIPQISEKKVLETSRKKLLDVAKKEIISETQLSNKDRNFLLNYFTTRHRILQISLSSKDEFHAIELARRKVIKKQRELLLEMEKNKEIDTKILKILDLELDLEENLIIKAEIK